MITPGGPIRGQDLASCNTCGALMPIERRGMHQQFHDELAAALSSRGIAIQKLFGLIEVVVARRPRWFR